MHGVNDIHWCWEVSNTSAHKPSLPADRYKGVSMGYSIILSSYITVAVAGVPAHLLI